MMVTLLLAGFLGPVAAQELTAVRPTGISDGVLVAYADRRVAVAVGAGNAMPDGSKRVRVYSVYRHGTAESAWTTPAYSIAAVDVHCEERSYRVGWSYLFRGNGDPVRSVAGDDGTFVPAAGDRIREAQLDVACGDDERPGYPDFFLFMEAYGLEDGRMPRSSAGPMIP